MLAVNRSVEELRHDIVWGVAICVKTMAFLAAIVVPVHWFLTDRIATSIEALVAITAALVCGVWGGMLLGMFRPLATRDVRGALLAGAMGGALFYVVPWFAAVPMLDYAISEWIMWAGIIACIGAFFGVLLGGGIWWQLGRDS